MLSFLSVKYKASSVTVAAAVPTITADNKGNLNAFGKAFERMAVLYRPGEAFSFQQGLILDYPTTSIADIEKRAACTKSVPHGTMPSSLTR